MLVWVVFAALSIGVLLLSWPSMRRREHGLPRAFAFVAILAVVALSAPTWFVDPFAPVQLASWALLMASALLATHGFHLLRVVGRPSGGFEQTSVLVRRGAYRVIRHPLYASLLLLVVGAWLKQLSLMGGMVTISALILLTLTARVEEAENLVRFGDEYADYMRQTRMFIPYVF
jgi:protein-S-isoprenylcysteine O-methyltransferase Ste14